MEKVNAENFKTFWKENITHLINSDKNFLDKYLNNKSWTDYFLKEGDIINLIKKEFGLRERPEEYKIDMVFAPKKNLSEISTLVSSGEFFPPCDSIILEHENNIKDCWREMSKLTHYKARLKVLVCYKDYNESISKEDITNEYLEDFKSIVRESNTHYSENPETEYLMIIGQRNKKGLHWRFDSFTLINI
ncbi:hypothetical protein OO013_07260 [Mangrovivirga sp. M17]|uniref:Uncharacterized protein n=1 Tax=Mangrovivirga halotolerans TaxID=2993936 RepID=A0ABT3RPU7_9BACT|nr:hypothetical protein [Mangrovivirga halotolerans]MCX2743656.1 hypothetical protein [Mangrovivirga halotolerans]